MSDLYQLLLVSAIWALAVVLYYFAGKKHGYHNGYIDGHTRGSNDVFGIIIQHSKLKEKS